MNRAPSEDLHNSLLASQDLAFFEEIHKKVSHDQIRECYDDIEGCQTWSEVGRFSVKVLVRSISSPNISSLLCSIFEPFQKPFVVSQQS